jgi:hypothetical protein
VDHPELKERLALGRDKKCRAGERESKSLKKIGFDLDGFYEEDLLYMLGDDCGV